MSTEAPEPPSSSAPPPGPAPDPQSRPPAGRGDDLGLTSLVLGAVSVAALVLPRGVLLSPLLGLAAVVTGAIGLGKAPAGSRSRSLLGLILGAAAIVAIVAGFVILHFWLSHPTQPYPGTFGRHMMPG